MEQLTSVKPQVSQVGVTLSFWVKSTFTLGSRHTTNTQKISLFVHVLHTPYMHTSYVQVLYCRQILYEYLQSAIQVSLGFSSRDGNTPSLSTVFDQLEFTVVPTLESVAIASRLALLIGCSLYSGGIRIGSKVHASPRLYGVRICFYFSESIKRTTAKTTSK